MNNGRQDVTVVGAGLIGLSTAMELLQRRPGLKLTVVEKADGPGSQQSGHNSGVIHSGIYYKPGSFKARFCVEGRASMTQFCLDNEIPVWECGKLIVATNPAEEARLEDLWERGTNNAVEGLRIVDREEMGEIEPFVEGTKALYAPKTGIVDYRKVADVYSEKVQSLGGEIRFNSEVKNISPNGRGSEGINYTIETTSGEIETKYLVNCAGLHSDLIAAMSGVNPGLRIVPFRGEYYTLAKSSEHMVKGLIYPVPDPSFPFLGVHLTQTMKGWVEAGPNAVLALKREGYRKRDFSFVDFGRTVTVPRILEDVSKELEGRTLGDESLVAQGCLPKQPAKVDAFIGKIGPRTRRLRRTGPSGSRRRHTVGRLPHRRKRDGGTRSQCAVTRCHVVAGHRQLHR